MILDFDLNLAPPPTNYAPIHTPVEYLPYFVYVWFQEKYDVILYTLSFSVSLYPRETPEMWSLSPLEHQILWLYFWVFLLITPRTGMFRQRKDATLTCQTCTIFLWHKHFLQFKISNKNSSSNNNSHNL